MTAPTPPLGDAPADNLERIYADSLKARAAEERIRSLAAGAPGAAAILLADIDNSRELRRQSIATKVAVLGQVLDAVRASAGAGAEVCDLGTRDEFVVVARLGDGDAEAESMAIAERVRAAVAQGTWVVAEAEYRVTASIGVAVAPVDAVDPHALLLLADSACRDAKDLGRDRCERARQGLSCVLETQLPPRRRRELVELSARTGQPVDALLRRAVDLVLQRHSGLEQFCEGIGELG